MSISSLPPGSTIGKYRISTFVARGGMGEVFRAEHATTKRVVALKVMYPHLSRDEDSVRRFRREAEAMGELSHPNILEILDAGTTDGYLYIAMPFASGGTLANQLTRLKSTGQKLAIDQAISILCDVADALHHAHTSPRRLIHRDIKPSNVLIDEKGRYLLGDFGIVTSDSVSSITQPHGIVGTPEYVSPEQVQGRKADARSDVYALGIMLYDMLAGQPPFSGDTPLLTINMHVTRPAPALRQARPDAPVALEKIVRKALEKAPDARFQSAAAFADALRAVVTDKDTAATRPPTLALLIGSAITATLVMGGVALLMTRPAVSDEALALATSTATRTPTIEPSATSLPALPTRAVATHTAEATATQAAISTPTQVPATSTPFPPTSTLIPSATPTQTRAPRTPRPTRVPPSSTPVPAAPTAVPQPAVTPQAPVPEQPQQPAPAPPAPVPPLAAPATNTIAPEPSLPLPQIPATNTIAPEPILPGATVSH
jgi:eukaryotic-like serine/threonine-protein kinase